MLLQSVKAYNATVGLAHVKILEPGIIYPIDWRYTSQDWKNAGAVAIGCSKTSLMGGPRRILFCIVRCLPSLQDRSHSEYSFGGARQERPICRLPCMP